jgi:hypothetical protein
MPESIAAQAKPRPRVEKILEDALLKISVVISDLLGVSGRRFLDALVAGSAAPGRWPRWATRGCGPPASSSRTR